VFRSCFACGDPINAGELCRACREAVDSLPTPAPGVIDQVLNDG
jgi:hypothetical protein